MIIYTGTSEDFKTQILQNRLADIMQANFHDRFGYLPSSSEYNSWQNSLSRVKDLIELSKISDTYLALEYEVPYNQSRIDCLLFGKDTSGIDNVVLIELKQWSLATETDDEGNFVETFTGGMNQIVAHPSQQAKGYHNYLKGFVAEFETEPVMELFSCAYCHNYSKVVGKGLHAPVYTKLIEDYPLYSKEDAKILADRLFDLLSQGEGTQVFNRFMQSPIRPAKKLLQNVSKIIKNEAVFSLLNEQLVAKNLIWSKVRKSNSKSVVIVHGGPGTGKSIIALNVLAEAAKRGKKVYWGCKSKPFTEGIKKLVGKDAEVLFSNLFRFIPTRIRENDADLLLIDEAHRIESSSNHQYTRADDRTEIPQIDQLIRCAKTSVFFIDDKQNVRGKEVGSTKLIKDAAIKLNATISEVTLLSQFRCMGSDDYLSWLDSVLGYTDTKLIWNKNDHFDFRIFSSPDEMYDALAEKDRLIPNSSRMVAGFCWQWSRKLDANGELVKDVQIGSFAMPWETPDEIRKPPAGYVNWTQWAIKREGFKQVGCIYTAQGFEFDYIGVIIGDDLTYDKRSDSLIGNASANKDPMLNKSKVDDFDRYVKNIYRVLMSRGMKGCFVCFVNPDTRDYFQKHLVINS